ncbi:MAG: late competence development ComFB family protein [Cyanophyceae cyanobacterium]
MKNKHQKHIHYNIMEWLVLQEVNQQLTAYPATLRRYINRVEVVSFALNHLPSLYASSQRGFEQQQQRGYQLQSQIQTAVQRGFAAVQRDPLRKSTPLTTQAVASATLPDGRNSQVATHQGLKDRRQAFDWNDARYCR